MPTFFARSVSVRLSASDLEKSITTTPLARGSKEASEHVQRIASELGTGSKDGTLPEMPICEDGSGSHILFLGKYADMPFIMVQAGERLLDSANTAEIQASPTGKCGTLMNGRKRIPSTSGVPFGDIGALGNKNEEDFEDEICLVDQPGNKVVIKNTKSAVASTEERNGKLQCGTMSPIDARRRSLSSHQNLVVNQGLIPSYHSAYKRPSKSRALCLTVSLSNSSFILQPNCKSNKPPTLDVKIDVFFNGMLCASTYVPERNRNSLNGGAELTQRFTGRRVTPNLERPWIIIPPGQDPDGDMRACERSEDAFVGVEGRWNTIAESLRQEAEKGGRDRYGELTVLGAYLESLSQVPKPKGVESLQKAGGPKFGVIDVVLTAGKGQKDPAEAGAVSEPTSLRVSALKPETEGAFWADGRFFADSTSHSRFYTKSKTCADDQIIAQGTSDNIPRETRRSSLMDNRAKKINNSNEGILSSCYDSNTLSKSLCVGAGSYVKQGNRNSKSVNRPPSKTGSPIPAGDIVDAISSTQSKGRSRLIRPKRTQKSSSFRRGSDRDVLFPQSRPSPPKKIPASNVEDEKKLSNNKTNKPHIVPQKRYKGSGPNYEGKLQAKMAGRDQQVTLIDKMTLAEEMATIEARSKQKFVANAISSSIYSSPSVTRQSVVDEIATASAPANTDSQVLHSSCSENSVKNEPFTRTDIADDNACLASCQKDNQTAWTLGQQTQADLRSKMVILRLKQSPREDQNKPKMPTHMRSTIPSEPASSASTASRRPTNNTSTRATDSSIPSFQFPPSYTSSAPSTSTTTTNLTSSSARQPKNPIPTSKPLYHPPPPPRRTFKPYSSSTPTSHSSLPTWPTPPSSEDCVINFAPDSVRQVRVERPGWFKESCILVGVRFLIGNG